MARPRRRLTYMPSLFLLVCDMLLCRPSARFSVLHFLQPAPFPQPLPFDHSFGHMDPCDEIVTRGTHPLQRGRLWFTFHFIRYIGMYFCDGLCEGQRAGSPGITAALHQDSQLVSTTA